MDVMDICRMAARSIMAEIGPWGDQCAFFGGLIPGILVPHPARHLAPHIGTRDVDLAIQVATLREDQELYRTLKRNLIDIGLKQNSRRTFEWSRTVEGVEIIVELFVPVEHPEKAGKIQKKPIEQSGSGLTALGIFGLDLMQRDIQVIEDEGPLFDGKGVKKVNLRVCGPAMLLALKAWALKERNKTKDGYDVVWMLKALGSASIANAFFEAQLQETKFGVQALRYLAECYSTHQHSGPQGWVIESAFTGEEAAREARDAVGLVREFLYRVRMNQ